MEVGWGVLHEGWAGTGGSGHALFIRATPTSLQACQLIQRLMGCCCTHSPPHRPRLPHTAHAPASASLQRAGVCRVRGVPVQRAHLPVQGRRAETWGSSASKYVHLRAHAPVPRHATLMRCTGRAAAQRAAQCCTQCMVQQGQWGVHRPPLCCAKQPARHQVRGSVASNAENWVRAGLPIAPKAGGWVPHAVVVGTHLNSAWGSGTCTAQDSLGRLSDIAKVEAAKADEAGWAARKPDDRQQQEAFYESTQGTARGYMRMAVASLGWLNKLAQHPQVRVWVGVGVGAGAGVGVGLGVGVGVGVGMGVGVGVGACVGSIAGAKCMLSCAASCATCHGFFRARSLCMCHAATRA